MAPTFAHLEGGTEPRKLRSSIKQDIKTNTVVSVRVASRCHRKHPISVSAYIDMESLSGVKVSFQRIGQ